MFQRLISNQKQNQSPHLQRELIRLYLEQIVTIHLLTMFASPQLLQMVRDCVDRRKDGNSYRQYGMLLPEF
jgi:hypothetical protein